VIKHRIALLALIALTGCGGGGGGGASGGGFVDPCPVAPGVVDSGATLTSPAKGASGVSTAIGTLSFTVTNASLRTGIFKLLAISPANATPVVYSGATTVGAGGVLSIAIPALQPRTTYDASVAGYQQVSDAGCLGLVTADLGTFTTQ
jgi:hypothetical protein